MARLKVSNKVLQNAMNKAIHVKNKHRNIQTTEMRTKETTNTAMTSIKGLQIYVVYKSTF